MLASRIAAAILLAAVAIAPCPAQTAGKRKAEDSVQPRVVTPGDATHPPSDAVAVFNGRNMDGWVRASDGSLTLVGLSGTVLTAAGGADPGASASWTLRQQADRKGLSAVLAEPGARLVVVGEDGTRTLALR